MKGIIRLLRRLGWWKSPAEVATESAVRVMITTAPRPMGFRECAWERWMRSLEGRPDRWPRLGISCTYFAFTHNIDHTVGLLGKVSYRPQGYNLQELLSWKSIDQEELTRHSVTPAERLLHTN